MKKSRIDFSVYFIKQVFRINKLIVITKNDNSKIQEACIRGNEESRGYVNFYSDKGSLLFCKIVVRKELERILI